MTNNITKIEEILKNLVVVIKLGEIKAVPPSEVENVRESVVKELQALIEKREREAVEGFKRYAAETIPQGKLIPRGDILILAEQYLQREGEQ